MQEPKRLNSLKSFLKLFGVEKIKLTNQPKKELVSKWNEGWKCLFEALEPLAEKDLEKEIYIRNMGHSILEAINRQLTHYPYHIGQIVFIGKII